VCADPAVVAAAWRGIQRAGTVPPLLMVSLNDDTDPHFRKAHFDPQACPPDCPRPCERVCPVGAITATGVEASRCYGCGRCLDICPYHAITARTYVHRPAAVIALLQGQPIAALEIHTQTGHEHSFAHLWRELQPWVQRLQVLAISCPDHPQVIPYLWHLYEIITPLPCALIWQADGRLMSGDIGPGTTWATIRLAQNSGAGATGVCAVGRGHQSGDLAAGSTLSSARAWGRLRQLCPEIAATLFAPARRQGCFSDCGADCPGLDCP